VKQAKLVGALYLENNLIPPAFTPNRLAILELLASQAAISLENARLYAELRQENSDRRKAEEALRESEQRRIRPRVALHPFPSWTKRP
jgi:GAF domain-containing protein